MIRENRSKVGIIFFLHERRMYSYSYVQRCKSFSHIGNFFIIRSQSYTFTSSLPNLYFTSSVRLPVGIYKECF